ncbi:MAG: hypothetical protein U0835_16490 [Isosphaeraceae bacterium]
MNVHEPLSQLQPSQAMALMIVMVSVGGGILVALTAIIVGGVRLAAETRARTALTQQMLDRGMSADEIALVLDPKQARKNGEVSSTRLACAAEAVVEHGGDWYPALVLEVGDDQYFIHYVGHDMDSNEWVTEDRIRFPAGSSVAELRDSSARRNGLYTGKPPVVAEV